MKALGTKWTSAGKDLLSIPSDRPRLQIDYVLFRGFNVGEARVIDEPVASDHRPVLVVLEPAK
jgi:endonuclease/exonuclease/phosphatase (EEP) superfamily protein YafD